jgi:hypothetical protein
MLDGKDWIGLTAGIFIPFVSFMIEMAVDEIVQLPDMIIFCICLVGFTLLCSLFSKFAWVSIGVVILVFVLVMLKMFTWDSLFMFLDRLNHYIYLIFTGQFSKL